MFSLHEVTCSEEIVQSHHKTSFVSSAMCLWLFLPNKGTVICSGAGTLNALQTQRNVLQNASFYPYHGHPVYFPFLKQDIYFMITFKKPNRVLLIAKMELHFPMEKHEMVSLNFRMLPIVKPAAQSLHTLPNTCTQGPYCNKISSS